MVIPIDIPWCHLLCSVETMLVLKDVARKANVSSRGSACAKPLGLDPHAPVDLTNAVNTGPAALTLHTRFLASAMLIGMDKTALSFVPARLPATIKAPVILKANASVTQASPDPIAGPQWPLLSPLIQNSLSNIL